jgi:L-glyceraldehyde 3-phosphate reductase
LHTPSPDRYRRMTYSRSGRSGLDLPRISLGLWHNLGGDGLPEEGRRMVLNAFDHGITHFDLANNYGPPAGSAEANFGSLLTGDLRPYRDELVISTKAGYWMWDGPYGEWGSRKYLLASLDQSLARLGVDYVDIFYSHRFDPSTPLEETMGALDTAVRSGKALYAGISSYGPEMTRAAAAILDRLGTPLLIHQPSYSMLNRWVEHGLLDVVGELGIGCIVFSPLAQGLLSDRYLEGIPPGSRAVAGDSFDRSMLSEDNLGRVRALNDLARQRGQTLAQMAISWVLRDERVTSALMGASRWEQIEEAIAAVGNTRFSVEESTLIDRHAVDADLNLWAESSDSG